jgi:hypothetical protein
MSCRPLIHGQIWLKSTPDESAKIIAAAGKNGETQPAKEREHFPN